MSKIRKIALLLALFMPFNNTFSQSSESRDCIQFLYDAIRSIVFPDMEEYMAQYTKQIMRDSDNNIVDSVGITHIDDVVIISFNSEEYVGLSGDRDHRRISRARTRLNLLRIVEALDRDCTVRYDLFDSFIYRYSIRLENGFGWDAEYRIKMDGNGMRIIGREINIVSPSQ